jgi:hypothetical protein
MLKPRSTGARYSSTTAKKKMSVSRGWLAITRYSSGDWSVVGLVEERVSLTWQMVEDEFDGSIQYLSAISRIERPCWAVKGDPYIPAATTVYLGISHSDSWRSVAKGPSSSARMGKYYFRDASVLSVMIVCCVSFNHDNPSQ